VENKFIPARERSPEVDFRYGDHQLHMRGEAYPEDASAFFGPLLKELEAYCEAIKGEAVLVEFQLVYFNTSSAKALMNMIKILEASARDGTQVTLNWIFQKEDDVMREFGEDFSQDLHHVQFHLVQL
jgi:hypothetical protein